MIGSQAWRYMCHGEPARRISRPTRRDKRVSQRLPLEAWGQLGERFIGSLRWALQTLGILGSNFVKGGYCTLCPRCGVLLICLHPSRAPPAHFRRRCIGGMHWPTDRAGGTLLSSDYIRQTFVAWIAAVSSAPRVWVLWVSSHSRLSRGV